MNLTKSTHHNENYLASIVEIKEFHPHPNADRLKMAAVYGNNVITGIDSQPGLYCYFPLECALSQEFLSLTNSFRDPELNADKTKKGLFEAHCRIRAVRLRGEKSEGYIVPAQQIIDFAASLGKKINVEPCDFDEVCGHQICKKYIPKNQKSPQVGGKKTKGKIKKWESKLIENQFRFHESTGQLKKEINKLSPDEYIAISMKLHGCNFIVSNVLCKRRLSFTDKIARFFGAKIQESEYGLLYSSRAVIKNANRDNGGENNHYYGSDIWKIVADKIYPSLAEGISVTGEIVGYTPEGKMIQKNYDYGCAIGTLDFYIFKVTYTSPTGHVYVFSHRQTEEFCKKFGLKMPKILYYGKARDLFDLDTENHWHENFLNKMIETYLEKKCSICKNDVWEEGVVLRRDIPFEWDAQKLKSFNFNLYFSKYLDSGGEDLS